MAKVPDADKWTPTLRGGKAFVSLIWHSREGKLLSCAQRLTCNPDTGIMSCQTYFCYTQNKMLQTQANENYRQQKGGTKRSELQCVLKGKMEGPMATWMSLKEFLLYVSKHKLLDDGMT